MANDVEKLFLCLLASLLLIILLSHPEQERAPEEVHLLPNGCRQKNLQNPICTNKELPNPPARTAQPPPRHQGALVGNVWCGQSRPHSLHDPNYIWFWYVPFTFSQFSLNMSQGPCPLPFPVHLTRAALSWHVPTPSPLFVCDNLSVFVPDPVSGPAQCCEQNRESTPVCERRTRMAVVVEAEPPGPWHHPLHCDRPVSLPCWYGPLASCSVPENVKAPTCSPS